MNSLKKCKEKGKRAGALALALATFATSLLGFGQLEAKAAPVTVLENNTGIRNETNIGAKAYGHSSNTAYEYGLVHNNQTTGRSGRNTEYLPKPTEHTFNFTLKSSEAGNLNGYYNVGNYRINLREEFPPGFPYASNSFLTRYMFDKPSDVSGADNRNPLITYTDGIPTGANLLIPGPPPGAPFNAFLDMGVFTYNKVAPQSKNGEVRKLTIPGTTEHIEVRQTVMPTEDEQYLLVEYTVHNPNNRAVDFTIGNASDTQLAAHDNAPIVITKQDDASGSSYEGVHYHATQGPNHILTTFDIYTDMKPNKYEVGITKRDAADRSRIGAWAGTYRNTRYGGSAINHAFFAFNKLTGIGESILMENGDSAVSFSAYFDLHAHETKTARFAVAAKEHVYYVNGDITAGLGTGYLGSPVKKNGNTSSIAHALQKTETDNGGNNKKNLYIMVQKDEEINETIVIPQGYELTILSADYGAPGIPKEEEPNYSPTGYGGSEYPTYSKGNHSPSLMTQTVTLKRGIGFTGPLFKIENGSTLNLLNITIDGNKDAIAAHNASIVDANGEVIAGQDPNNLVYVNSPLIENEGNLIIGSDTVLQNADTSNTRSFVKKPTTYTTQTNGTDASGAPIVTEQVQNGFTLEDISDAANTKASAIYSTGKLTFKGGTIRQNVSADQSNKTHASNANHPNAQVVSSGAVVIDNADPNAIVLDSNSKIEIIDNTTMRYRHTEHINPDGTVSTKEMTKVASGSANLYLRDDEAVVKVKSTTGRLHSDTKVGLKIDNPPKTQTTGRLVVQREPESGAMTFASGNFSSDAGAQQLLRMGQNGHNQYTGAAPTVNPSDAEHLERLYIKKLFSSVTYHYVDENGSPILVNGVSEETQTYANNSRIVKNFGAYPNHVVGSVTLSPSDTNHSLRNNNATLDIPNLNTDVIVNVRYTRPKAKYVLDLMLDATGETTDNNIANITNITANQDLRRYEELVDVSATGSNIHIANPSKIGYTFMGWKKYENVRDANATEPLNYAFNPQQTAGGNGQDTSSTTLLSTLTIPAPTQEREEYYYAVWKQNILSVPLARQITNNNANLLINFETKNDAHPAAGALEFALPYIVGYKHYANEAGKRVESVSFGTSNVAASTNAQNEEVYTFTGTMPASSARLTFKYDVDTQKKFTFAVKHVDEQGNELFRNDSTSYSTSSLVNVETLITSNKEIIPGYTYHGVEIREGRAFDPLQYLLGLDSPRMIKKLYDGSVGTSNTGLFEAYMPNQNVTIVYTYTDNSPSKPYRKIVIEDSTHPQNGRTLLVDKMLNIPGPNFPIASDTEYGQFYGLTFHQVIDATTTGAVVDAQGNVGNYTQNSGGTLTLGAKKGSEWNTLKFGFVNNGFETNANMQYPVSGTDALSILTTNGTTLGNQKAMKFSEIQAEAAFPNVTPNPYYLFEGWFREESGTTQMGDTDVFAMNAVAPHEHKVFAKIVEDPSKWVDVNFVSDDVTLGTLSPVTTEGIYIPGSLSQHLHFDATWNTVTKPNATAIANYELKGWIAPNGSMVRDTDTIVPGTYRAVFGKRDATWGLGVGAFGATGNIGADGSGTVSITGVTPGNVYIVTDPSGTIVGVATGTADDLQFPGLVPGRRYEVIEGTPDTVAAVGNASSTITGSQLSSQKPVIIPAIGDNKSVGVDPQNPERAQIVINPADPDAEYALIDANGNVVTYPNAPNGWIAPTGSGVATVTFRDLAPGETYTVVARKRGNASETPNGNMDAGVSVVANPGSMVEATNYRIETKTNGVNADVKIISVGDETVNSSIYESAKANTAFRLYADPTDGNGNPFLYWVIMNGRIPGVSGRITTSEYDGVLAQSNVIFKAVYDVLPKNDFGEEIAPAEQENRGNAAEGEFAASPESIALLEKELSNPTDVSLININGAEVRYKVVFDKRASKPVEKELIQQEPSRVWDRYPEAFTAAWSLDIKEERYVDGRLVQNATPSDAALNVSVQLEANDTDMLDYEIWDMGRTVDGNYNPIVPTLITQVHYSEDVENNAGYLSFEGRLNHTYVLVYAKTFKLYFIDNHPTLHHKYLGDTNRNFYKKIKVRKKDAVSMSDYSSDYTQVTDYADMVRALESTDSFDDIYGVTHTYAGWARKEMPHPFQSFDLDAAVTRTQNVFAYYNNNRADVTQARADLTALIPTAVNLKRNPYLRAEDLDDLTEAIAEAQNVLSRIRGRLENGVDPLRMATYPELLAQIDALQSLIARLNGNIRDRNAAYIRYTGGSSGGGTGSHGRGGGGASGTPLDGTSYKNLPLSSERQNTFTLGVDGQWVTNIHTKKWAFMINGGLLLNDKWARIDYKDGEGKTVTDWYRFDLQSSLMTGWHYDTEYKGWYYLNPTEGKDIGKMVRGWHKEESTNKWYYLNKEWGNMKTGWHEDSDDKRWYYLDQKTGEMAVGWHFINGKWYFFNMRNSSPTWMLVNNRWVYKQGDVRPYGSMYREEVTPDGYRVGADGAWIQ